MSSPPEVVIGLDLGDRKVQWVCIEKESGARVGAGSVAMTTETSPPDLGFVLADDEGEHAGGDTSCRLKALTWF